MVTFNGAFPKCLLGEMGFGEWKRMVADAGTPVKGSSENVTE